MAIKSLEVMVDVESPGERFGGRIPVIFLPRGKWVARTARTVGTRTSTATSVLDIPALRWGEFIKINVII